MGFPNKKLRKFLLVSLVFASAFAVSGYEARPNGDDDSTDETSTEEVADVSAENVSSTDFVLEAEFGNWQMQLADLPVRDSLEMKSASIAAMTATPTVSSFEDMQRHILGDSFTPNMRRDKIESFINKTFQQVPGVPLDPRYEEDRFDIVRRGFSQQCSDSVDRYQRSVASMFVSSNVNVVDALNGAQQRFAATSYESACLTALENVPNNVRQILGVLTIGAAPFCSATIVGSNKVLTSRHCFVDPSTGSGLKYLDHWKDGNLSFVPAVPQNSRSSFKLEEPSAEVLSSIVGKFGPTDDYWVAYTTRTMEFAATYEHASQDGNLYPITAWLVGSNINLDDIGQERTPLEFVRGAAPTACAVLEKTAKGCIYHTCQSSHSTSGAGILVPDGLGSVKLIGVHKGTIAEAAGCEPTPPISLRLNFGISDLSL